MQPSSLSVLFTQLQERTQCEAQEWPGGGGGHAAAPRADTEVPSTSVPSGVNHEAQESSACCQGRSRGKGHQAALPWTLSLTCCSFSCPPYGISSLCPKEGRRQVTVNNLPMVLLFVLQSPNSSPVCPILSRFVLVLALVELTFFTVADVELCYGFVLNTELTIKRCSCNY